MSAAHGMGAGPFAAYGPGPSGPAARRRGPSAGNLFLGALSLLLVGYAVAGKGFAYLGLGPVHVGELVLAAGLLVALATGAVRRLPRTPTVLLLGLFMAWSALRTLAGVPEYGSDALRDGALWGYALFALVVASLLLARPPRLRGALRAYAAFARAFPWLIPWVWLLVVLGGDALPRAPGSDVPLVHAKSGDVLVHLAGVAAFQLVGMGRARAASWAALAGAALLTMVRTRGGMLALLLALSSVAAARPRLRRLWVGAAAALLAAALLLPLGARLEVDGRPLSLGQLTENVTSIFGSGRSDLEGTRSWRLAWWSEIVAYTFAGPHFWLGRGYGPNLASEDGFEVDPGRTLRSPHNGHLTVLARSGVPGLALWLLLQASFALSLLRSHRRSRRARQARWSALFVFLLAYWIAFVVNAAFDVYLEGPMGGIWFWSLFGVGLAAVRIHARWPFVLEDAAPPAPGRASP